MEKNLSKFNCLCLKKMNTCHNNPKKSSTTKIDKHAPSGYSLFTHCSFDTTKNKLDRYRDEEMISLTKEEKKIHRKQKVCHIGKKGFSTNDDNKKYHKVKDHCHYTGKYRGAAHNICNLRYKIPK